MKILIIGATGKETDLLPGRAETDFDKWLE
jgi:hypothetical protein